MLCSCGWASPQRFSWSHVRPRQDLVLLRLACLARVQVRGSRKTTAVGDHGRSWNWFCFSGECICLAVVMYTYAYYFRPFTDYFLIGFWGKFKPLCNLAPKGYAHTEFNRPTMVQHFTPHNHAYDYLILVWSWLIMYYIVSYPLSCSDFLLITIHSCLGAWQPGYRRTRKAMTPCASLGWPWANGNAPP